MEFLRQVFINTPIWVWPLFIVLVAVGLRNMKTRSMPIWPYYLLPFMLLMSVNALRQHPQFNLAVPTFLGALVLGALLGYALQKRWVIAREGNRVQLAGEPFTLIVMLGLFGFNFAGGMLRSVAPQFMAQPLVSLGLLAILTAFSATFLGRSIRVLRG